MLRAFTKAFACASVLLLAMSAGSAWPASAASHHGATRASDDGPNLLVNEVLPGVQNGFIELYNPADSDLDLSGWSLHLCMPAGERTYDIPWGMSVAANGYFVLASESTTLE